MGGLSLVISLVITLGALTLGESAGIELLSLSAWIGHGMPILVPWGVLTIIVFIILLLQRDSNRR